MSMIIKGVAPPAPVVGSYNYMWEQLAVGDHIIKDPQQAEHNFRNTASIYGRRLQRTFSVRKVEDGTVRCWRLK